MLKMKNKNDRRQKKKKKKVKIMIITTAIIKSRNRWGYKNLVNLSQMKIFFLFERNDVEEEN